MRVLALALALALSACVTAPPTPTANPRAIWCDLNDPRVYTNEEVDAMTRGQMEDAAVIQLQGQEWCVGHPNWR